ncbi:MAG TPA: hypothetical protein VKE25_05635 [Actinomycetes bacterium]|nr:hypothetical protein [Actinomycetes bacterium]
MTLRTRVHPAARALLAVVVGAVASGCGLPVRDNGGEPLSPRPAVHAAAVGGIVDRYVQVSNAASAGRNITLLRSAEMGASLAIDIAIYRADRALDPSDRTRAKPITYQQEASFVPRLAGYPRWFAIQAKPSYPRANSALLVFVQRRATEPWLQSALIDLGAANAMPKLAYDGHGNAIAVPVDEKADLLAAPSAVAAAHAGYLTSGDRPDSGPRLAADPWTTELIDAARTDAKQFSFARVSNRYQPTNQLMYAFQTADGGAVVVYAMKRSFDAELGSGSSVWRLAGMFGALAGTDALRTRTLHVEWRYQWLVQVPPAGDESAEVRVIGRSGGLTEVSRSD